MSLRIQGVGLKNNSPAFKSRIVKGSELQKSVKRNAGYDAMNAVTMTGILVLLGFIAVGVYGLISSVKESIAKYKAGVESESPKAEQNIEAEPFIQD